MTKVACCANLRDENGKLSNAQERRFVRSGDETDRAFLSLGAWSQSSCPSDISYCKSSGLSLR